MNLSFFYVHVDCKQDKENQTPATRVTKSIRQSRFAAHNAFHHCDQCHHYCEAGAATQVSCTTNTFCFTADLQMHISHPCVNIVRVCGCVVAVGVHLSCFHLLLVHAGRGGPAPVCDSQI